MGRIGKGVFGLLLALGLFAFPVTARASDGFLGGLEDLTGNREVQSQDYEREYSEEYEPELRAGGETSEVEELSTQGAIESVVNQANNAKVFATIDRPLVQNIPRLFVQYPNFFLLPAAGLVFMWWGVRKAKNMIMTAFRKGKASV